MNREPEHAGSQVMRQLMLSTTLTLAVVLGLSVIHPTAQNPPAKPDTNADAAVLADFKKRIDKYLELHKDVEKGSAKQKETNDPSKIRSAQTNLAARIRGARKDARPGEIFTPEIRAIFRRLMYPELKGQEGRDTKAQIKEDSPSAVPLKVNAPYPEGKPLPTVPPNLLKSLPQLPEELEYRIIDKHLILRDVDANLIVDYIPNAIR
jgi:hypothetical protein